MVTRRVYDQEKHVHFVTFSCDKRRQYLNPDRAKRIVIGTMGSELAKRNGLCSGFVIMPDHVHTLMWFPEVEQLSSFMDVWKTQTSRSLKNLYRSEFQNYWQRSGDRSNLASPILRLQSLEPSQVGREIGVQAPESGPCRIGGAMCRLAVEFGSLVRGEKIGGDVNQMATGNGVE